MAKLGKRYRCSVCGGEYLTTIGGPCPIFCCGKEMEEVPEGQGQKGPAPGEGLKKTLQGCRYHCEKCGVQLLNIVPAAVFPSCCGQEMTEEHLRMALMSE